MKNFGYKKISLLLLLFIISVGFIIKKSSPLENQLKEVEIYIIHRDHINKKVSKVDVAWHLDHILKVINNVSTTLEKSDPNTYKGNFNFTRFMSFTFNYIPRGKIEAVASVRPPENIETKDIKEQLLIARQNIVSLKDLHKNSNFKHPVFNVLNRNQSERFLEVHTKHHLKIIKDILNE